MNTDDRRDRDRLTKMLRRRLPEERIKPTTPELMDQLTRGFQDEYATDSEQRQNVGRLLFNDERTGQ